MYVGPSWRSAVTTRLHDRHLSPSSPSAVRRSLSPTCAGRCVSLRQSLGRCVSLRQSLVCCVSLRQSLDRYVSLRQSLDRCVSLRQSLGRCVSLRQSLGRYVSLRQSLGRCVSLRQSLGRCVITVLCRRGRILGRDNKPPQDISHTLAHTLLV